MFGFFGLRRNENFPDSIRLLANIGSFSALVPLQIIRELRVNLLDDEMKEFYRLQNELRQSVEISWEDASPERVAFYRDKGCRKGDALVAAHAEASRADLIVSRPAEARRSSRSIGSPAPCMPSRANETLDLYPQVHCKRAQ